MKARRRLGYRFVCLAFSGLLAACATTPQGSTVPVMPAPNKPFEVFANDQAVCSQYAQQQVSGQAQSANQQAAGVAVLGTLLGAGLGAAIGGGQGAAIGAASGALGGTALGAANSQNQQARIQQQYDNAYAQCMYAKGNQVPGTAPVSAVPPPPPPGQGPASSNMPSVAPPPPQAEAVPPLPGPNYVWQPGYWQWNGAQYVWIPGRYSVPPSATAVWIPDHWQSYGTSWLFVPGHWQG